MKVKLTQQFDCVPDGEVYPKLFAAGEIVSGNVAQAALDQGKGTPVEADNDAPPPAAGAAPEQPVPPPDDPPPVIRAKLLKKIVHADESYARGLIVEGDLARRFIDEGVAELIAPADKSVTAIPETK